MSVGGYRCIQLTVDDSVNICIHHTVDISSNMALNTDCSGCGSCFCFNTLQLETGALDDGIAQHQEGGQYKQNKDNGNDRATTQAGAHGGNNGLGRQIADQQACGCHDGAGGEYGGERRIQRMDNGFFMGHMCFQFLIVAGDDDGIVNIGTHHNGIDDQITKEVQWLSRKGREREVDPDTALDHDDQQHWKSRRLECKE